MAMQTETPPTAPSAEVVGNAFVEQYYHILHQSPDSVYKFYQDSSVLSRPDADVFSLHHRTKDTLYVEGSEPLEASKATSYEINDTPSATSPSLTPHPEPSYVPDPPVTDQATSHVEENQKIDENTHEPQDDESRLASEKVTVDREPHSDENHISAVTEPASPSAQEGTPKKSYASIVSSQTKKGNAGSIKIFVPANSSKVAPTKTEKQSQAPAPEASVPTSPSVIDAPESSDFQDEGEGHSIYIRNLPLNATVAQLEVEFKKFGPIKQGGVQVRNSKQQGFCFGFVEFEDVSSIHSAIQASPVTIGNRQAAVEIKRTTTRVGSGRGRFPSGRGGFRNDSFRGRGTFNGSRSFGRNDFIEEGVQEAAVEKATNKEGGEEAVEEILVRMLCWDEVRAGNIWLQNFDSFSIYDDAWKRWKVSDLVISSFIRKLKIVLVHNQDCLQIKWHLKIEEELSLMLHVLDENCLIDN
ncbi:hypothetical protein RJ640_021884 [Escallonia rubra]|uniref:G3BP-like protein n=1 Tax=Escallonia rubra TaxID=112253 RepID=A0AA88RP32_9ASTE|nr:hypothetical protein RJ640_021884 [Escallonia rubra]